MSTASDSEVNRNRRVKIRREHRPARLMERTAKEQPNGENLRLVMNHRLRAKVKTKLL